MNFGYRKLFTDIRKRYRKKVIFCKECLQYLCAHVPLSPHTIIHCLSPLPWFESQSGHVRKLPTNWGKAVIFTGNSGLIYHLQLVIANKLGLGSVSHWIIVTEYGRKSDN